MNDINDLQKIIKWENKSIFLAQGGYARIIALRSGALIATYSNAGKIFVKRSADEGLTWSEAETVTVAGETPQGLPADITNANAVELDDGRIMVAYRKHTVWKKQPGFYSSIRCCIGDGSGWSDEIIAVENTYDGCDFSGFWEPHMRYVADGRLAMYYSSDCLGGDAKDYPFVPTRKSQYIIMHFFNPENNTFGAPVICSDGVKHASRDGMSVICRLSDGSYAMVIESSADKANYPFIIKILFSDDGIAWGEPVTVHSPTVLGNYAGAPYIVALPDGRIAISCQATEDSGTTAAHNKVFNSKMRVLISKEPVTRENRDRIAPDSFTVIPGSPLSLCDYSIWPAMCVCGDTFICNAELGNIMGEKDYRCAGIYLRRGKIV